MSLIPEEELRREKGINFAPMVDFLFLVVAILATLAITRSTLHDENLELVKVHGPTENAWANTLNTPHLIHLVVTSQGQYKWLTETNEHTMDSIAAIQRELEIQLEKGILPQEKSQIKVLLHVDKQAPWESIVNLIFAVRGSGFKVHPVYAAHEQS